MPLFLRRVGNAGLVITFTLANPFNITLFPTLFPRNVDECCLGCDNVNKQLIQVIAAAARLNVYDCLVEK